MPTFIKSTPRVLSRLLFCGALLLLTPAVADDEPAAQVTVRSQYSLKPQVKDLKYGEVLYNFFQDKYFSATVQLEVAKQQQRIPGNADEAELLLGGLYLSYGLHEEAEQIFNRLINQGTKPATRDRAWFYLGKIRYHKGLFSDAAAALAKVEGELDPDLQPEFRNIQANLLMANRQYQETAALLQKAPADSEIAAYDRYNLGVAQLAGGETEAGIKTLESLAATTFELQEFKALADKTWLALGYAHLGENPVKAKYYFEQVRLNGPFSNRALLGVGWANYVRENYRAALPVWLELSERPRTDHSVYESYLAIASALERLTAGTQAAQAYDQAIVNYQAALTEVDGYIASVRDGRLPELLLDKNSRDELGWFWEADVTPEARELYFLRDLIAGNAFQEALKNLRDLRFLRTQLNRWELEMPAYQHMIELRRTTYEEGIERLSGEAAVGAVAVLQDRRDRYAKTLEEMQRRDQYADQYQQIDRNAIEQLATPKERELMRRLDGAKQRLETLGEFPDRETFEQRYRLVSGLLYWNISTDYKPRYWTAKKHVNEVDRLLNEALEKQLNLERAAVSAPRLFTGYDQYINSLGLRIADIREHIDTTYAMQEMQLNNLALAELIRLRQRLNGYLDQAHFSLARLKDRASARPGVAQ